MWKKKTIIRLLLVLLSLTLLMQPVSAFAEGERGLAEEDANVLEEARGIYLRSIPQLFLASSILLAAILLFGVYRHREELAEKCCAAARERLLFVLLMTIGLFLRALLASLWGGHDVDINCFIGWGRYMADKGADVFYTGPETGWCDYPPGSILMLGGIARAVRFLHLAVTPGAEVFAYMLPAYMADVAMALLLMHTARQENLGEGWTLLLGALVIFNPAAVVLSGAWGQIDSILTLLLLLCFLELRKGRRICAGAIYGLAVMCKWQALIFGPVLAAAYLFTLRSRKDLLKTAGAVAAALTVISLLSLPFRGEQAPLWLAERFTRAGGGYDYASVEAYNFQALLGGNWASAEKSIFASVSYKAFGTAAIFIAVFTAAFTQWRTARWERRRRDNSERSFRMLFLTAAFCIYTIYTFGHYMHERYVFPAVFLLLFVFLFTGDVRFFSALCCSRV